MSYRTIVVDPRPIIGLGIMEICRKTEFAPVDNFHSLTDAAASLQQRQYDLLLIGPADIRFRSFEFCMALQDLLQHTRKIMLGSTLGDANWESTLAGQHGIDAIAPSGIPVQDLLALMREVVTQASVMRQVTRKPHRDRKSAELLTRAPILTVRERDVVFEIACGKTNSEIAQKLGISFETAKEHVANILRKLKASTRVQAAVLAINEKLIQPPETE
ncbi:MAG TPA: response regulator transcription factor [Pirellulaceae bacterium]|nr:response regulator transcription factor [Pirellulaceae bacterium]HMO92993.1 response regulator transcription factor [Pirellulaceae bacterium]HMP67929.1 response regulator transcription factor [Pirellulaceae bacterium]